MMGSENLDFDCNRSTSVDHNDQGGPDSGDSANYSESPTELAGHTSSLHSHFSNLG